jgi:VanZ family protein
VLKKVWFSFVPALIWLLFIVVGSFMSTSNVPKIAVSDKGIHFIFYAIFAFLLYFPLRVNTKRSFTFVTTSVLVLLVGLALGAVVELIQHYFIIGRFGEYLDILANTIGLLVGLLISEIYKRKAVL